MKKKYYLLALAALSFCLDTSAQEWASYSDSIIVNIRASNHSKARGFLKLAEKYLLNRDIKKDTIYADFLYRRGLLTYFQNKNPEVDFNESIKIWNKSQKINPKKLMRLHYFSGYYYDFVAQNYGEAYKQYKLCYNVGKLIDFDSTDSFKDITYRLYLIDRWQNSNEEKSKEWAIEYIKLKEHVAFDQLDLDYSDAYGFVYGDESALEILEQYLILYVERKIEKPLLLERINMELMDSYFSLGNYTEVVKIGEALLNLDQPNEKKSVYISLIAAYGEIGDNINRNKYIKLSETEFPAEKNKIDHYDDLKLILINEEYEKFESLFKEYETQLIKKKDFNSLIRIYTQSLTLFEQGLIFKTTDIEKQKSIIEENLYSLSEENKIYFDFYLAEYSFFIQDYARAIQIADNYLDFKEDAIRLGMYKLKAISEKVLGTGNGKETAYKALEIASDLFGADNPQILAYLSLVLSLDFMGDDNQTTHIGTKALEIIYNNDLGKTDIAAQVWYNLGLQASNKNNFSDAELYYKNSIGIYESYKKISNVNTYYSCLLGLSRVYNQLLNFKESLKYLNKTKDMFDSNPNMMEPLYGDYFYYLGDYYFWQDMFLEAKENYENALGIYGETMSKGRDFNLILSDYFLSINVDTTIKKLENYYDINGNIGNVLSIIYLLKFNTNQTNEARGFLISNINKIIKDNNEFFHLLSDEEREIIYRNFTDQFEFLNSHLLLTKDTSFLEKYINYRFYLKSLLFYNSSTDFSQNEESRSYLNQLKANTVIINKYYEQQDGNNYLTEINEIKQKNRELEKFLSQSKGLGAELTIDQIKNELTNTNAYVEIIRINKQSRSATKDKLNILNKFTDSIYYGAVVLKKDKKPKFILISESNKLEEEYLKNYNSYINGNLKFKVDKNSYSLFFETLDKELKGLESIYLVTDGIYNSINPETFYNPNKDKYVLEYLDVKRIISARSLINKPTDNSNKNLTATLIGNPEFELVEALHGIDNNILASTEVSYLRDYASTKQIGYLPGTEKEILSLENILKKEGYSVDLFSANKATEGNLKAIKSPKILHLATHGYFLRIEEEADFKNSLMGMQSSYLQSNVYLKSGLLLTGAQNTLNGDRSAVETDNGVFTAFEAKNLDLKNTELVVLSACETGIGDNLIGEGVYGLQRAFMIAGAKGVIMSLWQVDDNTTQKLMQLFYTNWIEKGMPKAVAFKTAKIELKKDYPEPFYWAPFILIE